MNNGKINSGICYTNGHVNRTYNSTNTKEKNGCEHDQCLTRLQEDDGGKQFVVPLFTVMRTYKPSPSTRWHRPSPTL